MRFKFRRLFSFLIYSKPSNIFCVGFLCSTFVLDFVSLIFFPDVDDFSCGCFLFSCFFPFDILFLIYFIQF